MSIEDQFWGKMEQRPLTLSNEEAALMDKLHTLERYIPISRQLGGGFVDALYKREDGEKNDVKGSREYYLHYMAGFAVFIVKILKTFSPKNYAKVVKELREIIIED